MRAAAQPKLSDARAPGKFYQPELDGLRFLAFFAVYLAHSLPSKELAYLQHPGFPRPVADFLMAVRSAGAFGVDLFFVLSAYLITELLLRERLLSGTVHVKDFYIRRAFRIWPLYFVFLLIAALVGWHDAGQRLGWHYQLPYLLFVGNWAYVFFGWPGGITDPLWSISVEEQFYLLWPPVMRRLSPRAIGHVALGLIAVSAAARLVLGYHHAPRVAVWTNTLTRLDPIACGALLAVLLNGRMPRLRAAQRAALFAGGLLALLVAAHYGHIDDSPQALRGMIFAYPLAAAACAVLLLAALRPREESSPFLKHRATVYLGRISYGLYMFHTLALYVVHMRYQSLPRFFPGGWYVSLSLVLTIGMAALSYRVLEQPFLRLKHRFAYVESGI